MANNLPGSATIIYGGFTFSEKAKTSVGITPIYDEADRTVIRNKYSIQVIDHILGDEDADDETTKTQIEAIVEKLSYPGQDFRFVNTGFRDIEVNLQAGGQLDSAWGPKPRVNRCHSIGNNLAWVIEWSCDVEIPECGPDTKYKGRIAAFNYGVSYSFDQDGYTTRTYAGYLEIPMTRSRHGNGRLMPDCVDEYREFITPALPEGFRRLPEQFNINYDKRRIDFSITDEEIPRSGLPAQCTQARGSHTVGSMNNNVASRWTGNISATYNVKRNLAKVVAYQRFFELVMSRLYTLGKDQTKFGVIPTGFEASEGLYLDGRVTSFRYSYTFATDFKTVVRDSRLWTQIPGTSSAEWVLSMHNVIGVRGIAGLRLKASDDVIVDMCAPVKPKLPGGAVRVVGGALAGAVVGR